MMKIDDASNSRCMILSDYKYKSVSEHPCFIRPMVGDSNNTTTVSTLKNNVCCKQMLNTNKLSKDLLCSPLADNVYISGNMAGPFSSNWNDRSHVHPGKVQRKATTHADIDYMNSRSAQLGTDRGKVYAGKVQDKPVSHLDASYLYSKAAKSHVDRETDVNISASSRTNSQLELSQPGSKFHVNCPADSLIYQGHETRRRSVSLEAANNVVYVEDHLGALTTIDEENTGASSDNCRVNEYYDRGKFDFCTGSRSRQNAVHSPAVSRYKKRTMENPDFGRSSNHDLPNSDYCQRMPASSVATESHLVSPNSQNRSEELLCNIADRSFCCNGSVDSFDLAPSHLNGEGWQDYSRLLEKHFDIPPHNIDQAGRVKCVYSNIHDISYMDTKRQVATCPPVHSVEQRLKPTIPGNRALRVSGSEMSLNRLGQSDHSTSYGKSGEQEHGPVRSDSEFDNNGYTSGMSFTQPRHRHVRSSMPDLRCQDNSWFPESDSEFMPHSFHGNRCHHHQQSPQEQYVQLRDYPRFHMSQQLHASPATVDQCMQTHRNYNPGVTRRECVHSAPPGNLSDSLASLSYQNDQDTVPRQLFHCSRDSPVRAEQTSRISGSSFDLAADNKPRDLKVERHSLDLCNIPQLQKQIRATSELCLQASRRHMFASSADIHKLFSGQIKAPKSVSSSFGKCWDSLKSNQIGPSSPFHINTNFLSPSPAQEILRRDQRFTSMPSEFVQSKPLPCQARTDQCFRNLHETSMQKTSLSSLLAFVSDTSASPALRQSLETYPEVKKHHVHRNVSSSTEVDTEQLLLQRQLSDYSSETELQLIESNAEEVKNMQGTQESARLLNTSAKNFTPIHTAVEKHPKAINLHDGTEREPVYANGPVLATSISNVVNKSCHSEWFRQRDSLPHSCTPSYVNPHFTPALSEICGSAYANPYLSSVPSAGAFIKHHKQYTNSTTTKPGRFQSAENADFSSSSSSGESGTIWQDSNISYNSISNSNLMAAQNQTSQFPLAATSHSSPVSYKRQHNIIYTNIPATLASEKTDVNTSNPHFTVRQSASFHDLSVPYSSRGDFYSPASYLKTEHSVAGRNHVSSQEIIPDHFLRNGYSTPYRHSDLEGLRKLNLSFDANAVFEDEDDRLSTLV